MELKLKKYIYRGRETDPVGKEMEAVKIKNKNAAPSKLKKEMGAN